MSRIQTYVTVVVQKPADFDRRRFIFDLKRTIRGFRGMNYDCQRPKPGEPWVTKVVLSPVKQQLNGAIRIKNAADMSVEAMSDLLKCRIRHILEHAVMPRLWKEDQFPMISYETTLPGFSDRLLSRNLLRPELYGYLFFIASRPGSFQKLSHLKRSLQRAQGATARQITLAKFSGLPSGTADPLDHAHAQFDLLQELIAKARKDLTHGQQ